VRELEAPEPTRVGAGEGAALGVYIGTVSLFFVLVMATNFFGSATYSVVGPYMAEIWPTRLRASGMGLCYGVGISGKILGPLGLAVILGAGDPIKPAPNLASLGPAFTYFASWYILGAAAFWLIGFETQGRSFEEMDRTLLAKAVPASTEPIVRAAGE
jgi:MFS transporter, putative metabolite:H+ symporter